MPRPALVTIDGDRYWTEDGTAVGKLHRTDGPAFIMSDGSTFWYLNGVLHREDGPAVDRVLGGQEWLINGSHHRLDGPAVIYANGDQEWYLNGIQLDPIVHFLKVGELQGRTDD